MSIKMMSAVWQSSEADQSTLLLLLALADFANDEGLCWPSVKTLARKARITERWAQRLLVSLVKGGALHVDYGAGPKGVNVYTLSPGGFSSPGVGVGGGERGELQNQKGVVPRPPKPSLEPSLGRGTG